MNANIGVLNRHLCMGLKPLILTDLLKKLFLASKCYVAEINLNPLSHTHTDKEIAQVLRQL